MPYYKKNVMFERECLLLVLAPDAFPSPPAAFREYSMNHNHVAHLPAKFFSSATTASSSQASASSICPPAKAVGASVSREAGLAPSLLLRGGGGERADG